MKNLLTIITLLFTASMAGQDYTRTFESYTEFLDYHQNQLGIEMEFFQDSITAAFKIDPENVSVEVGRSHYRMNDRDRGGVMFWGGCYSKRMCIGQNPFTQKTLESSCDKRDFSCYREIILYYIPNAYSKWSDKFHYPNKIFEFAENEIKFDFVTGNTERMIAKAHSPLVGDTRIIINIDKWDNLNHKQRIWLLLHEFGHEYYGMEHGDNKLMYPLMPSEDLKKLGSLDQLGSEETYSAEMEKYDEDFLGGIGLGGTSRTTGHADNVLIDAIIDFCDFIDDDYMSEPKMTININEATGKSYNFEDAVPFDSRRK